MRYGVCQTNCLGRDIEPRAEVVGVFPNDEAIVTFVGAIFLEQNDEWAVQRSRCMTLKTIAASSGDPVVGSPALAIRPIRPKPEITVAWLPLPHHARRHDRCEPISATKFLWRALRACYFDPLRERRR